MQQAAALDAGVSEQQQRVPRVLAASSSRSLGQQAHSAQLEGPHQRAAILQLLAGKDQPLLVRGDACSISGWLSRTG